MATNQHARLLKAYLEDACEQLDRGRRIVRSWKVWVGSAAVVGAAVALGAGCSSETGGTSPEVCNDDKDNDGDGKVDCADEDCMSAPNCNGVEYGIPIETDCTDQVDNDGDGKVDCADSDCADAPGCSGTLYGIPFETDCTDQVDNDGDGKIDCADSDCANDPKCQ